MESLLTSPEPILLQEIEDEINVHHNENLSIIVLSDQDGEANNNCLEDKNLMKQNSMSNNQDGSNKHDKAFSNSQKLKPKKTDKDSFEINRSKTKSNYLEKMMSLSMNIPTKRLIDYTLPISASLMNFDDGYFYRGFYGKNFSKTKSESKLNSKLDNTTNLVIENKRECQTSTKSAKDPSQKAAENFEFEEANFAFDKKNLKLNNDRPFKTEGNVDEVDEDNYEIKDDFLVANFGGYPEKIYDDDYIENSERNHIETFKNLIDDAEFVRNQQNTNAKQKDQLITEKKNFREFVNEELDNDDNPELMNSDLRRIAEISFKNEGGLRISEIEPTTRRTNKYSVNSTREEHNLFGFIEHLNEEIDNNDKKENLKTNFQNHNFFYNNYDNSDYQLTHDNNDKKDISSIQKLKESYTDEFIKAMELKISTYQEGSGLISSRRNFSLLEEGIGIKRVESIKNVSSNMRDTIVFNQQNFKCSLENESKINSQYFEKVVKNEFGQQTDHFQGNSEKVVAEVEVETFSKMDLLERACILARKFSQGLKYKAYYRMLSLYEEIQTQKKYEEKIERLEILSDSFVFKTKIISILNIHKKNEQKHKLSAFTKLRAFALSNFNKDLNLLAIEQTNSEKLWKDREAKLIRENLELRDLLNTVKEDNNDYSYKIQKQTSNFSEIEKENKRLSNDIENLQSLNQNLQDEKLLDEEKKNPDDEVLALMAETYDTQVKQMENKYTSALKDSNRLYEDLLVAKRQVCADEEEITLMEKILADKEMFLSETQQEKKLLWNNYALVIEENELLKMELEKENELKNLAQEECGYFKERLGVNEEVLEELAPLQTKYGEVLDKNKEIMEMVDQLNQNLIAKEQELSKMNLVQTQAQLSFDKNLLELQETLNVSEENGFRLQNMVYHTVSMVNAFLREYKLYVDDDSLEKVGFVIKEDNFQNDLNQFQAIVEKMIIKNQEMDKLEGEQSDFNKKYRDVQEIIIKLTTENKVLKQSQCVQDKRVKGVIEKKDLLNTKVKELKLKKKDIKAWGIASEASRRNLLIGKIVERKDFALKNDHLEKLICYYQFLYRIGVRVFHYEDLEKQETIREMKVIFFLSKI